MSLGYLLSLDFEQLATQRTGKENPSFVDMKAGFWLSEDPIGASIICPRDGRPGCALVDWIPPDDRREQTHFLSWTWKYTLAEVASALKMFQQSMEDPHAGSGVFFFMCFFTNNQFRIIVEESSTGSANWSHGGHFGYLGSAAISVSHLDRVRAVCGLYSADSGTGGLGDHCLCKIAVKFTYCNVCRLGCSLTALPRLV